MMFTDWDFRICLLALGCLLSMTSAGVIQNRSLPHRPLTSEEFKKALTAFENDDDVAGSEEGTDSDLFEGDIVLPTEAELREVTKDDGKKWKKSEDGLVRVPYEIPGHFSESQRLAIARTVMEYAAKTCIRLVPFVDDPNVYPNPHIRFSDKNNRYASPLGMNGYTLNKIDIGYNNVQWGKVTHEVMHTLGFFHEHTRLDRDQYLRMNWNNIGSNKEQYRLCKWVPALHAGCRAATTEYDYASIMHYPIKHTGWDGKKKEVMTPLREVPAGVKIGQRRELSPGDVKGIRDLYQCAEGSHDSTIELPPVKVLDCPANDPYYEESGQCERWGIAMGKCGRIRDKSDMMARKCPTTCCENLKALGIY